MLHEIPSTIPDQGGTMPPPEVAALARALGDAVPAEVLFGIGGGTGFARVVDGGRARLETRAAAPEKGAEAFLAVVCRHLHVPCRVSTIGSAGAARKAVAGALSSERVPVLWTDEAQAVAVLDLDDEATVFDGRERRVPAEALLESAAGRPMLLVDGQPGELSIAIRQGLEVHRLQMREAGLGGLALWTVQVAGDNAHGESLAAQIDQRGGGPAMREAQVAFLAYAGYERAVCATATAAERWASLAAALRVGKANADDVRPVHDAESDALAALETTLRTR